MERVELSNVIKKVMESCRKIGQEPVGFPDMEGGCSIPAKDREILLGDVKSPRDRYLTLTEKGTTFIKDLEKTKPEIRETDRYTEIIFRNKLNNRPEASILFNYDLKKVVVTLGID